MSTWVPLLMLQSATFHLVGTCAKLWGLFSYPLSGNTVLWCLIIWCLNCCLMYFFFFCFLFLVVVSVSKINLVHIPAVRPKVQQWSEFLTAETRSYPRQDGKLSWVFSILPEAQMFFYPITCIKTVPCQQREVTREKCTSRASS